MHHIHSQYFTTSTGRLHKVPKRCRVARMHTAPLQPTHQPAYTPSWSTSRRFSGRFSLTLEHPLLYDRQQMYTLASALATLTDPSCLATALSTAQASLTPTQILDTNPSRPSPASDPLAAVRASEQVHEVHNMLWSSELSEDVLRAQAAAAAHAGSAAAAEASGQHSKSSQPSTGTGPLVAAGRSGESPSTGLISSLEHNRPRVSIGLGRAQYDGVSPPVEEQPTMLGFLAVAAAGAS